MALVGVAVMYVALNVRYLTKVSSADKMKDKLEFNVLTPSHYVEVWRQHEFAVLLCTD